jgi:S-adenosyl-L-methionine hydrolase (adenosine-forming)
MNKISQAPAIVTLTTDFGLQDSYVGIMKGVILSKAPGTQLIDICHAIPPHNIQFGASIIARAYKYFPDHSYHLVVVDPGVGSSRPLLALEANEHIFVAPDNGLLSSLLTRKMFQRAHRIENRDLFLRDRSNTFHGRDIMAPVIGHLAHGLNISEVGSQVILEDCIRLSSPQIRTNGKTLVGEIFYIDIFGNMQTTIDASAISNVANPQDLQFQVADIEIKGLSASYNEKKPGEFLTIIDSNNQLEIAVNCGNAAQLSGGRIGQKVTITLP